MFTHLHIHTQMSLLDGSTKINELVERVKEMGMTSCAITDHGNMFGVIDFYKKCKEEGIKPIIGCEVYVAPYGTNRFDRSGKSGEDDSRYNHLILLAKDNLGYQNLCKIVSKGWTEGFTTNLVWTWMFLENSMKALFVQVHVLQEVFHKLYLWGIII